QRPADRGHRHGVRSLGAGGSARCVARDDRLGDLRRVGGPAHRDLPRPCGRARRGAASTDGRGMNSPRLAFAAGVLAVTSLVAQAAYNGKPGLWLGPSELPLTIGDWHGRDGGPLDAETMAVLRADGVINRIYARPADQSPV